MMNRIRIWRNTASIDDWVVVRLVWLLLMVKLLLLLMMMVLMVGCWFERIVTGCEAVHVVGHERVRIVVVATLVRERHGLLGLVVHVLIVIPAIHELGLTHRLVLLLIGVLLLRHLHWRGIVSIIHWHVELGLLRWLVVLLLL